MPYRIQRYGWVPDLPDARDHLYAASSAVLARLPASVDLRSHCPPVYDQGDLGSCTGNAIAGAIQFDRMKQNARDNDLVPSRLFIYYNERVIEGTVNTDSGAQIRDGIKSVAQQGACFEGAASDQWPYVIAKFDQKPPMPCFETALHDRATSYSRVVRNMNQFKGCLAAGYPFVLGFTVYESFESPEVARTGNVPMPVISSEQVLGGHAVLAVGYNDSDQRFIMRNSWGTGWGQAG